MTIFKNHKSNRASEPTGSAQEDIRQQVAVRDAGDAVETEMGTCRDAGNGDQKDNAVIRDAVQDSGADNMADTGDTRMWNAEEVRAAAEVAAAEWDAQCKEEESAEQTLQGHEAAETSLREAQEDSDAPSKVAQGTQIEQAPAAAQGTQETADASAESTDRETQADALDIPMMTNKQSRGIGPDGVESDEVDGAEPGETDGGDGKVAASKQPSGKKGSRKAPGKKRHGKKGSHKGSGKASGEKRHRDKAPKSRRTLAAQIALGIAVVGILGTGAYCGWRYYSEEILPGRQYESAVELRDGGALDDAIQVFTRLGDWGDAADQVLITELMKARNQIDVGSYEDALVTLAAVGDYEGTDEYVTQDLIAEANQALSDIACNKGLDLVKLYDYDGAAEQFVAAQAYTAREDAAELQEACENAFDEVYAASFAEGRDADEDLQMTMYLWVHSVITPGETDVPLGMQSDLSTGSVNSDIFGQAYMNYVYYGQENEQIFTFSYAGSEKDAADESRQVFLMAEFADDYEQVTTSKIYQDTGEVPAAPDIRLWNRVTDEETIAAVQTGIRNRLTMDLVASGELDAETYGSADHTFDAIATIDDGFTLKTAEEIAAEQAAAEAEAESAENSDADDSDGDDGAVTDSDEVEQVLQASAEAEVNDDADEADDTDSDEDSDSGNDAADDASDEQDEQEDDADKADDSDSADDDSANDQDDKDAKSDDGKDDTDGDASDDEEVLDYDSMTEEQRKAKAEEYEQQEEEERLAAQQDAVDNLYSDYAIMVDAKTGEILVSKDADTKMYPASMTKIMTILVAAENVTDLTDRAEITNDIMNYASERGLTTVGWSSGEKVTVADLMWGTALCSGADAAKALANYVAGSETNLVDLMNAKVEELGLGGTHFANCTGVYSDDNYTTPHDMALILYAAVQNPLARTVLSTRQYTTTFTEEHPAGITITNAFLRNMDQDQLPGVVLSAKTGFVTKSMFCAASYMIADDGEIYICVTGHADTSADCRADHASLYNAFAMPASHTDMEKYLQEILSGESSNVGTIAAAGEQ